MLGKILLVVSYLATHTPLWLFVFLGTLTEEIIGPIPSPLVLTLAGGVAEKRGYSMLIIPIFSIIAAGSKTLAAYFYYIIAKNLESNLPDKFFKFFGISREQIEHLGRKISAGRRDDITIFILRAIPFSPSATISLAAGFLKTDRNTFLRSTFLGYLIPATLYLIAGYSGLDIIGRLRR